MWGYAYLTLVTKVYRLSGVHCTRMFRTRICRMRLYLVNVTSKVLLLLLLNEFIPKSRSRSCPQPRRFKGLSQYRSPTMDADSIQLFVVELVGDLPGKPLAVVEIRVAPHPQDHIARGFWGQVVDAKDGDREVDGVAPEPDDKLVDDVDEHRFTELLREVCQAHDMLIFHMGDLLLVIRRYGRHAF